LIPEVISAIRKLLEVTENSSFECSSVFAGNIVMLTFNNVFALRAY